MTGAQLSLFIPADLNNAGRERPDGLDETVLEGKKMDSSFPEGFWHPYGRGSPMPNSRVVCLNADTLGQARCLPRLNSAGTVPIMWP